jgi:hypothetical protein
MMRHIDLSPSTALVHRVDLETAPDLVHRVRGLGFFKRHVAHGVAAIGRREGLPARFDEQVAPRVFLAWIDSLLAQRAYAHVDRRDYIVFGAGMLLKTLIETGPIRLLSAPDARALKVPLASVWPEAFLATSYCLSVLDAVLEQEGLETFDLSQAAQDLNVWQSFRENVLADPSLAIPYLDLFIGNEPNWTQPTWARARSAQVKSSGRRLLS